MKKVKYLEISLQYREDVTKAIEFNKSNNYEYIIVDYNNTIRYDYLRMFLINGYILQQNYEYIRLVHKNYNKEIEEV